MKLKLLLCLSIMAVLAEACVSEDYFNDLNSSPVISSTANLTSIDTLKIGKLKNINKDVYFTLPITLSDANANLKSLKIDVATEITLMDNNGEMVADYYDLDHSTTRAEVSKIFRLIPMQPGDYTITATTVDKFNVEATLSKQIYAFDNMPPKCVVSEAYYTAPPASLYQAYVDIRASFDQDARWGGSIAEYKAKFHYTWQEEPSDMITDVPGIFLGSDLPWESIGWVEAWVIDNEGAESDHIRIDLILRP